MMGPLWALALAVVSPDLGRLPPRPPEIFSVRWMHDLVSPELLEWRPEEAGGAAVDPATGLVLVGTRDGRLSAFRPDGTFAWEFRAASSGEGFEAPPLVRDGVAYVGSLDGRLFALDAATGKERWRYDAKEEIGSTPLLVDGLVVVGTLQDALLAVDARTGAWRWTQRRERRGEGFTIRGMAQPLLVKQMVIAGWSDGKLSALDPDSGAVRWERMVAPQGDQVDVDGLASDGQRIYAAAYSGSVEAIDPASGNTLWERKLVGASRLLAEGGSLYAVGVDRLAAFDARDGAERWSRRLLGSPAGPPAWLGGRLAVPAGDALLLVDPATGQILRRFDPGSGISAALAVAGRRAYALSNGGALLALDLR